MKTISKDIETRFLTLSDIHIQRRPNKGSSISIVLYPNGNWVLRYPKHAPKRVIEDFLTSKSDWILEKEAELRRKGKFTLSLEEGSQFYFFGKTLRIKFSQEKKIYCRDPFLVLPNHRSTEKLLQDLKKFLKSELLQYLEPVTRNWLKILDTKILKIRIKKMRSIWGSCDQRNNISFNLSLIHCPEFVINYIILHEICHTIHKNHSTMFWNLLAKNMPNYEEAENWLKKEGLKYIYFIE